MAELDVGRPTAASASIACERAATRKIRAIHLRIEMLSGIDVRAVRFCYELCTEATVAAGSQLEVEELEGAARCTGCGADIALTAPLALGPCERRAPLDRVAGDELLDIHGGRRCRDTCGCDGDGAVVTHLASNGAHTHVHQDGRVESHRHDDGPSPRAQPVSGRGPAIRLESLQAKVLGKNDDQAARNRRDLGGGGISEPEEIGALTRIATLAPQLEAAAPPPRPRPSCSRRRST